MNSWKEVLLHMIQESNHVMLYDKSQYLSKAIKNERYKINFGRLNLLLKYILAFLLYFYIFSFSF